MNGLLHVRKRDRRFISIIADRDIKVLELTFFNFRLLFLLISLII